MIIDCAIVYKSQQFCCLLLIYITNVCLDIRFFIMGFSVLNYLHISIMAQELRKVIFNVFLVILSSLDGR